MRIIPPSNSPTRHPPPMYRNNRSDEMEEEPSNDTPRGLDEMMEAMRINGQDAVQMDEVVSAFRRNLGIGGNLDSEMVNGLAADFMKRASVRISQSAKENEPKPSAHESFSTATPTETLPPRGDHSTPFDEDTTPTTNNATPMGFAGKSPAPSSRGRERSVDRSRSSRSRSRTPMGSFFRKTSPVPEGRIRSRSPARRGRSQSPLVRRFFGMNGKPDLSPENPLGAIPHANSSSSNRSGRPPTPIRPESTERVGTATPAAKSTDSFPTPPSTAGNTFCSPTPSQSQWTPRARRREAPMGPSQGNSGVAGVRLDFGGSIPSARPDFDAGLQQSMSWSSAPSQPNANVQPSAPPVQQQIPIFNVNLNSSKNGRKKTGRRGSDKRTNRAGGPEKAMGGGQHFAHPSQGISRTYSIDSGIQQQQSGPQRIFIGSPPSVSIPQFSQHDMSPEEMDMGTPENDSQSAVPSSFSDEPSVNDPPVAFNIGAGGKKPSGTNRRSRRNGRKVVHSPGRSSVHRRHGGIFPRTSPTKATKLPNTNTSGIRQNASGESVESSGGQTLRTESTCSSEIDYTGRRTLVSSLRDEARDAYTKHDFRSAVMKYTTALKVHTGEPTPANQADDLRAVLLANRAAALLMLEAFEAAGMDCQSALKYVSDLSATPTSLATDSGPALRAKLFARMGKALLRLGKIQEADQAFSNTINTAHATLAVANQISPSEETEHTKNFLTQLITDAEAGKIEVNRCREAAEELTNYGNVTSVCSTPSSRRNNMQALLFVNKVLEFAPASVAFHEKKVALLASLKRWRELAGHCERLAAAYTQFDGLFEDDLAQCNPFPGVQRAESLKSTFFDQNDPVESSTKKLGNSAAAEAAVRLYHSLLPYYLRALRLEERNSQASAAIGMLETYIKSTEGMSHHQSVRMKFAWLSREKDKLTRSASGKDRGDTLFRSGDYQLAAAQYTSCLTIDAEGLPDGESGEVSNAGGRYHAILHCNRAACLMALKKYHEAVTDCTSALRIHSHYMKAMLRRSRCYARLLRYEEAMVEFKRYIELVEKAKRSPNDPDLSMTPCLFDSPKEVKDEELKKVKQELEDVKMSKRTAEQSARSKANFNSYRRPGYQESYRSESFRSGSGDAHQRREQWYNQKSSSSRRWDSFGGRSPKRDGHRSGGQGSRYSQQQQQQQRSQSQNGFNGSSSYRQQRNAHLSPGSDNTLDHYTVLDIARNATEAQIKKAYRKMALRYHPDKNSAPEAADQFRRVKLAYEVLNDSASRRKYDAEMLWTRRF